MSDILESYGCDEVSYFNRPNNLHGLLNRITTFISLLFCSMQKRHLGGGGDFILRKQLMLLRNFKTWPIYWLLSSVVLRWSCYETVKKAHKCIISALFNHSLPMCSKICSQDENATDTAKTILPPPPTFLRPPLTTPPNHLILARPL